MILQFYLGRQIGWDWQRPVGAALAANGGDLHAHLFIYQSIVSLTQNILLHLGHRIAWQLINKNNILRNLEIRQLFLTRVYYFCISC